MKRKSIYRLFDRYIGIPILFVLSLFYRKHKAPPKNEVKKILILKFAALGDILLLIPTIRLIRKTYPQAEISFLSTYINDSVVKKIPYINEVINENVHRFIQNPFSFYKYARRLRKKKYDIIIDAEQWSRIDSILLCLIKHTYVVGFKTRKQYKHFAFSDYAEHTPLRHEVENFFALLEPLNIYPSDEDKKLEYYISEEETEIADKFWIDNNLENKKVICLHPSVGASGALREWGDDNFISLGKRILKDFPDVRFLITGSKQDYPRCENISQNLNGSALNIAGKFKLGDLALIKKSGLLVCVNTGIMHLASCLGTKIFALHGATNPKLWGPYDKSSEVVQSDIYCSPCAYLGHDFGCNSPECMRRIKVEEVYNKVYKVLSDNLSEPVFSKI